MPTLNKIFDKCGVALYQNESLDLDHYYPEPYQDEGDEIKVIGKPFETDESKKIRKYDLFVEDRNFSNFSAKSFIRLSLRKSELVARKETVKKSFIHSRVSSGKIFCC